MSITDDNKKTDAPAGSKDDGGVAKTLPDWLKALVFLGFGGGGVFAARDWFLANPWALGVAGVAGVVGAALFMAPPKGDRAATRGIAAVFAWMDFQFGCLLGGSKAKYLTFLGQVHRGFDVKGLTTRGKYTLELQRVFVELRVESVEPNKASRDMLARAGLDEKSHDIWRFLTAPGDGFRRMVTLGPPGSGKTTLMKHVALRMAAGRAVGRHRIPILIFLRDLAKPLGEGKSLSLAQAAHDGVAMMEKGAPPPRWFEEQLAAGRCLVLLDGYDEVADPAVRTKTGAWIEEQMTRHANARFIVTSRPGGYKTRPLNDVSVLEVRPFNPGQVERFVHNWYLSEETMAEAGREDEGVRLKARQGAEDLLRRLWSGGNGGLAELSVNPLLMTMIATVHRHRGTLPGGRVELFHEICEVFLGKRRAAIGMTDNLTPAKRKAVLQPLAHHLMLEGIREIDAEVAAKVIKTVLKRVGWSGTAADFFRDVEDGSGLLLERESGELAFAHLTFQEYLASVHMVEDKTGELFKPLVENLDDSWWRETTLLYAAQSDATPIVDACLATQPLSAPRIALAHTLIEEGRELVPALRERVERIIEEGLEGDDPGRFELAAAALAARRENTLQWIDDKRGISNTLVTCAEYQLFIDAMLKEEKYRQPDHWLFTRFAVGEAREPILGVRGSDAQEYCDWLNARATPGYRWRLPTDVENEAFRREDEGPLPQRPWLMGKGAPVFKTLEWKNWKKLGLISRSIKIKSESPESSADCRVIIDIVKKEAGAEFGSYYEHFVADRLRCVCVTSAVDFEKNAVEIIPNLKILHSDVAGDEFVILREKLNNIGKKIAINSAGMDHIDSEINSKLNAYRLVLRYFSGWISAFRTKNYGFAVDIVLILFRFNRLRNRSIVDGYGLKGSEKIMHRNAIEIASHAISASILAMKNNANNSFYLFGRAYAVDWVELSIKRLPLGLNDSYILILSAFYILREQIAGRVKPVGAIRLVRERVED